jgi:hypothetical protein
VLDTAGHCRQQAAIGYPLRLFHKSYDCNVKHVGAWVMVIVLEDVVGAGDVLTHLDEPDAVLAKAWGR